MSMKTGVAPQWRMTLAHGDEGVADGDDLVARPHADRQQREMQRRGAVGDGAGVRRADDGGELVLEARDLAGLASASRNARPRRAATASSSPIRGLVIGIMRRLRSSARLGHATRRPARRGLPRGDASPRSRCSSRGLRDIGEAPRHRIDRALGAWFSGTSCGWPMTRQSSAREVEQEVSVPLRDIQRDVARRRDGREDVGARHVAHMDQSPWSAGRRRR